MDAMTRRPAPARRRRRSGARPALLSGCGLFGTTTAASPPPPRPPRRPRPRPSRPASRPRCSTPAPSPARSCAPPSPRARPPSITVHLRPGRRPGHRATRAQGVDSPPISQRLTYTVGAVDRRRRRAHDRDRRHHREGRGHRPHRRGDLGAPGRARPAGRHHRHRPGHAPRRAPGPGVRPALGPRRGRSPPSSTRSTSRSPALGPGAARRGRRGRRPLDHHQHQRRRRCPHRDRGHLHRDVARRRHARVHRHDHLVGAGPRTSTWPACPKGTTAALQSSELTGTTTGTLALDRPGFTLRTRQLGPPGDRPHRPTAPTPPSPSRSRSPTRPPRRRAEHRRPTIPALCQPWNRTLPALTIRSGSPSRPCSRTAASSAWPSPASPPATGSPTTRSRTCASPSARCSPWSSSPPSADARVRFTCTLHPDAHRGGRPPRPAGAHRRGQRPDPPDPRRRGRRGRRSTRPAAASASSSGSRTRP